ncbi:MAG: hypothetical protein AAGC46_00785 [Solirubrobacteraceae bacterium]
MQVFGGITLTAAYALGAEALPVSGAAAVLVAIGLLQIVVGVVWLTRTRRLRALIVLRPGAFVAATLLAAAAVLALGGSNSDELFITSAMCWLVAAGYALPGHRWAILSVVVVVVVSAVWVVVTGTDRGGYDDDGDYVTAIIGLAAGVVPGLWLGRTTGATFVTLNRWHLVEVHDLGLVERLRGLLAAVDVRAAKVGELLPSTVASAELGSLRARLRFGIGLREDDAPVIITEVLDEVRAEYEASEPRAGLIVELDPAARTVELGVTAADALAAVLRRQLSNVARHAPGAGTVTVHVSKQAGLLVVRVEDDGAGALPFRAGTGTQWSKHQLSRVAGAARYYPGTSGVGFEITLPIAARTRVSDIPGLSVGQSLDRFADGMLLSLRWAGYVVDSLGAFVDADQIGARWLVMPIGAVVMECVITLGVPGLALRRDTRLVIASLIAVAVTSVFAVPVDSPDALIPSTTSAVVLAHLIYAKRFRWFVAVEILRGLAVLPLLWRYGVETVELLVVYPIGFSVLVLILIRFMDRARGLERDAADAIGRAALSGATVRGLALHHDAVDVVVRAGVGDAPVREAVEGLQAALVDLAGVASASLDPREAMTTGIEAAVVAPVAVAAPADGSRSAVASVMAGAVDRVTLIELAALAADERASCAPPGLFGRRRLRALALTWSMGHGGQAELTLAAEPTLGPPHAQAVGRLVAVAETIGVRVASEADALTLTFERRDGPLGP